MRNVPSLMQVKNQKMKSAGYIRQPAELCGRKKHSLGVSKYLLELAHIDTYMQRWASLTQNLTS
jgi:hypothetical protein